MDTFINTAILGVFTYTCAGDYEPMKKIGFALIIVGMVGTTIAYQNLKERIEKIERQVSKRDDIINNNTKLMRCKHEKAHHMEQ